MVGSVKIDHSCVRVTNFMTPGSEIIIIGVHLGLSVSSFAHNCGCVVHDGGSNLSFIIINKL